MTLQTGQEPALPQEKPGPQPSEVAQSPSFPLGALDFRKDPAIGPRAARGFRL